MSLTNLPLAQAALGNEGPHLLVEFLLQLVELRPFSLGRGAGPCEQIQTEQLIEQKVDPLVKS